MITETSKKTETKKKPCNSPDICEAVVLVLLGWHLPLLVGAGFKSD